MFPTFAISAGYIPPVALVRLRSYYYSSVYYSLNIGEAKSLLLLDLNEPSVQSLTEPLTISTPNPSTLKPVSDQLGTQNWALLTQINVAITLFKSEQSLRCVYCCMYVFRGNVIERTMCIHWIGRRWWSIQLYWSSVEQSGRNIPHSGDDSDMVQLAFVDAKFIPQNRPSFNPATVAEPFWFTPDYVRIDIASFDDKECRSTRRARCCLQC